LKNALTTCVGLMVLAGCSSGGNSKRLTVFAGVPSGVGSLDGSGSVARFNLPSGVAVDEAGNAYVADSWNHSIRKITPAGVVTTLAGASGQSGDLDGVGSAARFNLPSGVAVDGAGNVYVADAENHTIRKITPDGTVTTLAGSSGHRGSANGSGSSARFARPRSLAVDGSGSVYVADSDNHAIRKITPEGLVMTLAGSAGKVGSADGTGASARFYLPSGVAVDGASNVYVADTNNHAIRKITPEGAVTTWAGSPDDGFLGNIDGTGTSARFYLPSGVAVDGAGNVYVVDAIETVRRITPAAVVTTLAGTPNQAGSADGTGSAARFNMQLRGPNGVAVDRAGNLYVTDVSNSTIRKISPAGAVGTLAGTTGEAGTADGFGRAARFSSPLGVAVDGAGNVYVADSLNNTIRKVTASEVVTTLAGTAGKWGSRDGTGTAARFSLPKGVAVDRARNIYVADNDNNTIRMITPSGVVTTLAGTARQSGSADGVGTAAQFGRPGGVAVDDAGNVYVADTGNSTIRMITPSGVVTTLAGTASRTGSADGVGTAARFDRPGGVAVDGAGNVYVADTGNQTIRKIEPSAVVTTLAGAAGQVGSVDGAGAAARFNFPVGVAVDDTGNVYVADTRNDSVRKITPTGVVSTPVGTALKSGTVAGPLPATLFEPSGVAVDPTTGNLFIVLQDAIMEASL